MKLTNAQIESLVRRVVIGLEKQKLIEFAQGRDKAISKGKEVIEADFQREAQLEADVQKKLDEIEREQTDQFERHRMFKMLKQKMADERGIIL